MGERKAAVGVAVAGCSAAVVDNTRHDLEVERIRSLADNGLSELEVEWVQSSLADIALRELGYSCFSYTL